MITNDIIILGAGGNCLDILDAILEANRRELQPKNRVLGFLDDNSSLQGREHFGFRVVGPLASASEYPEAFFVNGIGSPANFWKKQAILERLNIPTGRFATIIHPLAAVSQFATLGAGAVVLQNATITATAKLGSHVIVLPGAVISHDVAIGDYCCVASGVCVAGGVRVGDSCYLGANCSVNNNVEIGRCSLIGMGAVVLKDIPPQSVAVGNPARILRKTF